MEDNQSITTTDTPSTATPDTATNTTDPQIIDDQSSAATAQPDHWSSSLKMDDDLRTLVTAKGYDKLDTPDAALAAAVKGLKGAESAMRAPPDRTLILPEGGIDENFIKENGAKLGIPETVEGYDFDRPTLPEGMTYDTDLEKKMLEGLHAAGATKSVAQAAVNTYAETMAAVYAADADALKSASDTTLEQLKSEWGANFETKKSMSTRALAHFADAAGLDAEATKSMIARMAEGTGDPEAIKLFAAIGSAMGEDNIVLGDGATALGSAMSKEDAHAEVAKIRNSDDYKKAQKAGGKTFADINDKISKIYQRVKK